MNSRRLLLYAVTVFGTVAIGLLLWVDGLPNDGIWLAALWPFGRPRETKSDRDTPVLAWLVPENPGAVGKYPVYGEVSRIGRSRGNDICIEHDTVSSRHAELRRRRDGFFAIEDLDSTNGVLVNGKEAKSRILRDNDIIELGEVRLRLLIEPSKSP